MRRKLILQYCILTTITILLFFPLFYLLCYIKPEIYDYTHHIEAAEDMANGNIKFLPPHFVLQLLLLLLHYSFNLSYSIAMCFIMVASQCICAAVVYNYLNKYFSQHFNFYLLLFFSIAAISLYSLPVFYFADHQILNGYFTSTIYHNPTFILIRPVALFITIWISDIFNNKARKNLPLLAVLVILSALVKPNYVLILLPSIVILSGFSILFKKSINLKVLLKKVFVPAVFILTLQFIWTYYFKNKYSNSKPEHIIIAPFFVLNTVSDLLAYKFFLSIAFPLLLLLLFFNEVKKNKLLQLSWVLFIVSLFFSFFLAENGPRFKHGNFIWGTHISTFILFFSSLACLLDISVRKGINKLSLLLKNDKLTLAYFVYLLHLTCGILYFISRFISL